MAGFGSKKIQGAVTGASQQDAAIGGLIANAKLLHSVERVAVLQQALDDLDTGDLPSEARFAHLCDSNAIVIATLRELIEEFHTLTLPLSEDHESRLRMVLRLSQTLDHQFAKLKADRKVVQPGPVLHNRVSLLLEELTFSAACYHPWSSNLWVKMHCIFTRAQELKVANYRPAKSSQNPEPKSLVETYLIAVLTAAADPYQMAYRDIQNARILATTFLQSVSLDYSTRIRVAPNANHRLLIDDRVDKPVLPYRGGKELDHHHAVLDLDQCYQILADRLETLEKDVKAKDPLFGGMQRQNIIGLYRHVLVKWGWQPTRSGRRMAIDVDMDLVLGYNNILARFSPTVEFKDPFPPLRRLRASEIEPDVQQVQEPQPTDNQNRAEYLSAVSIDVSDTGIGLKVGRVNDAALRVGELLAFRQNDSDQPWRLGVIRWVRTTDNSTAEVGVLKLSGELRVGTLLGVERARGVSAGRDGAERPVSRDMPVLITTESADAATAISAQVLLHTNMGDSDLVHWLSVDGTDRMMLSIKKFLSTRYVVAYGCHLSDPRTKPDLKRSAVETDNFVFYQGAPRRPR